MKLQPSDDIRKNPSPIIVFILLACVIVLVYSNTFNASWHLDDQPNILNNDYLHLNSLSFADLINTLYTNVNKPGELNDKMYRPVACFTFALNWYFGKDNVFGYHVVNIAVHIFTAFFIYLFLIQLFKTPNTKFAENINPVYVCVLASLLWATNPIQTQAVSYIVQRMAQLAAFFYILGMWAYIKARLCNGFLQKMLFATLAILSYILAIYSKSNAVMLPLSIVLTETIFFQSVYKKETKLALVLTVSLILGAIFLFGTFFFLKGNPFSVLTSYDHRTFTLVERLLAEPRVVMFHLSQIFFPLAGRFSIAHDITLSSSVFTPWTTLPSILAIAFMIGFSFYHSQKFPLLSFAVLFFFLNHIIESSIIGLEIIFEHRNYLPSFFLFLPLSFWICKLGSTYYRTNKIAFTSVLCFSLLLISFFSINAYLRNNVWKNDFTLWSDAITKAPNNARVSNILAIKLAWGDNSTHPKRYDMALQLFESSLEQHFPSKEIKADIYNNMANIYFEFKGNNPKAIHFYEEAIKTAPEKLKIRKDFAKALIAMKNFDYAHEQIDFLIKKNENIALYHNLKGHILLWEKDYTTALNHFKKAYELKPGEPSVLLNTCVALSLSGYYQRAEKLLLESIKAYSNDMTFYLVLIENSIRSGEDELSEHYISLLFKLFSKDQIMYGIENLTNNPKLAPISKQILDPVLKVYLKNYPDISLKLENKHMQSMCNNKILDRKPCCILWFVS